MMGFIGNYELIIAGPDFLIRPLLMLVSVVYLRTNHEPGV